MIRLPHRSVTRFFIPLIDVLTLLFCTFLLLPIFKAAAENQAGAEASAARSPEQARAEKIQEIQERMPYLRVLEISVKNGRLIYRTPENPDGRILNDEVDAQKLIDRDRHDPRAAQNGLYYLILYPRDPESEYPLGNQYAEYERWFHDVAHGYERPGKGIAPGGKA